MSLSEIIKDKKAEDFSREELIVLANENNISFKENTKDATIFKNLAKSLEVEQVFVAIKFLKSPTGAFNLAYNAGEEASLPESQAIELVENKFAEFVK